MPRHRGNIDTASSVKCSREKCKVAGGSELPQLALDLALINANLAERTEHKGKYSLFPGCWQGMQT